METADKRPHVLCIPLPFQSHIKAMMKLAKLIHNKGTHITFVNTEYNHKRLLKSKGFSSFSGLSDFRFETIPDGLPSSKDDDDATQDASSLCEVVRSELLSPFRQLVAKLKDPVSCIVSDGFIPFTFTVAQELGIPLVKFFSISGCGFMGVKHYHALVEKGILPLKDESYITNGYLDTIIDWIPGMKNLRLRDISALFEITDTSEITFNFTMEGGDRATEASAIIIQSFYSLEKDILDALPSILNQPIYSIGPLQLLLNQIEDPLDSIGYSLWKEDTECLQWLNSKAPNSVLYVNFGSIAFLTAKQLEEFAWGLANSKQQFLWIMRPDLVEGESAILPNGFVEETKGRSLITSWCSQEEVLNHPSVGAFWTHCGWNSILESLSAGVPMICWPFIAEQPANSWYCCNEWGVGIEIGNDGERDEVEKVVREMMEGEKGKVMRKKAKEWKILAEEAAAPFGSSSIDFNTLVDKVILPKGS